MIFFSLQHLAVASSVEKVVGTSVAKSVTQSLRTLLRTSDAEVPQQVCRTHLQKSTDAGRILTREIISNSNLQW